MTWLSEQPICSQESAGDYSQTSFWDTDPSLLSSGNPTPAKSSENEQQKDGFQTCECGKGMSDCSIHPSTPERWIASMQDSLARILALPENRQGLAKRHAVASTVKSSGSLAWYDPVTCSLRTSQQSLITDSEPSSLTLPSSGMTADGYVYELPTVGRIITGIGGGYWPTPTCQMGAMYLERNALERNSMSLASAVHYWPTPNASDCRDRGNLSMPSVQRRKAIGKQLGLSMVVNPTSGALNPDWVSWLMGFPIGFAKVEKK